MKTLFVHVFCFTQDSQTYVYDEKVQPAPGIGEVGLETISHPFKKHFNDKHVGENFVRVFQNNFDSSALFYVNVLKGLPKDNI